jgi:GNAT superfamily N-acetyltransferase
MIATRTDTSRRAEADFEIRPAAAQDAAALAQLSSQLGYPSSQEHVERRLAAILADDAHVVFVAQTRRMPSNNRPLAGWVHAYVERTLESDAMVEVGGLVVEENQRRLGAGRTLMEAVEHWAQENGFVTVTVRANVIRAAAGAHLFYERIGYSRVKNQRVFRKSLGPT